MSLLIPLPAGSYRVSSPFGQRTDPITGKAGAGHNGIDLAAPTGTPVYAAADGKVAFVMRDHAVSGNAVGISHSLPGIGRTSYVHLHTVNVSTGQQVRRGQKIGTVGSTGRSTGPHLHFIVKNPSGVAVDPAPLMRHGGAGGVRWGRLLAVGGGLVLIFWLLARRRRRRRPRLVEATA